MGALSMVACTARRDDDEGQADALTDADLAGKAFIHKETYAADRFGGYTRNSAEIEMTNTVRCVDGPQMLRLLRTERNGKKVYSRVRKSPTSKAFTAGFPIAEMTWDATSHAVRESSPFVWLTIEPERYAVDAVSGERELSLGTDIMDDTYYDTNDFTLLHNQTVLRARLRWDTPTEIRRILVGAKFGTEVDPFGIKSAAKVDLRNDGASAAEVASLDLDVRRGFATWAGGAGVLAPVRETYERLAKTPGALPSTSQFADVLLLERKAHLRAVRSRFHLNEATTFHVTRVRENGDRRIDALVARVRDESQRGFGAHQGAVAEFEADVAALRDGSRLALRVAPALRSLDPAQDTSPRAVQALLSAPIASALDADKQRIVAETQSALYHELARRFDGIRRVVARAEDRSFEDQPAHVVAWLKSADRPLLDTRKAELSPLQTYEAFVAAFDRLRGLADRERAGELAAYNAFGGARRAAGDEDFAEFTPRADADLAAIAAELTSEELHVAQRILEEAGTAHLALWFDRARSFYVPQAYAQTSNFMIDTMDMTEMVRREDWDSIPATERTAERVLPADKVFHAMLSNDVQIELGMEAPYVARLAALRAEPASPERDKLFNGAEFVFKTIQESMRIVGDAKGKRIIDELKKAGGPSCMSWGPVERSKGETALTMLDPGPR